MMLHRLSMEQALSAWSDLESGTMGVVLPTPKGEEPPIV